MDNGTVADRVRRIMDGKSEREFARLNGVPYSTMKGVLEGSRPSVDKLVVISDATKVSLEWLATGRGQMRPGAQLEGDFQRIPRYNAQVSAGNGSFLEAAKLLDHIPFTNEFFDRRLHRNPNDMIIVDASGESMEPTMRDRDLLMIDTSTAQKPITSAIYGFTYDQDVYVKRLFVTPKGIVAKSDNKEYGEFLIGPEEMEQFHPIGRVVWIGRTL